VRVDTWSPRDLGDMHPSRREERCTTPRSRGRVRSIRPGLGASADPARESGLGFFGQVARLQPDVRHRFREVWVLSGAGVDDIDERVAVFMDQVLERTAADADTTVFGRRSLVEGDQQLDRLGAAGQHSIIDYVARVAQVRAFV